jgi:hypothetical protein
LFPWLAPWATFSRPSGADAHESYQQNVVLSRAPSGADAHESYQQNVETPDIGEADAVRDLAAIRAAAPVRRTISECIALMPARSTAAIDPDFAKDVEAAIAAHREPLDPAAWD